MEVNSSDAAKLKLHEHSFGGRWMVICYTFANTFIGFCQLQNNPSILKFKTVSPDNNIPSLDQLIIL